MASPIQVFCGIPRPGIHFLNAARQLGSPLLMSANAFWKNGRFRGHEVLWDIEVPFALDCGGFTAMKAYGGYRWAIWDYVAQMEHCLFGDAAYIEGMGHDGWPDLVGVGSECRKRLLGEDGLMRVLDTLEGVLPTHVRLHLFGVKIRSRFQTQRSAASGER